MPNVRRMWSASLLALPLFGGVGAPSRRSRSLPGVLLSGHYGVDRV